MEAARSWGGNTLLRGQRPHSLGTWRSAPNSMPRAWGHLGQAEAGLTCGQERTGLVEQKGDRKEGRRPWAAADRGEREGRGNGLMDGREPGEYHAHRRQTRGPLAAPMGLHFTGRTEGGAVGLGTRTSLLPRARRERSLWRQEVQSAPTQDHRAQRTSHAATELNTLKLPSENRNQKHKTQPEMDQKQKEKETTLTSGKKWKTTKSS